MGRGVLTRINMIFSNENKKIQYLLAVPLDVAQIVWRRR